MATDESSTPKHGRHAAAGKHAAPRVEEPLVQATAPETEAPYAAELPQEVPATSGTALRGAPTTVEMVASALPLVDGDQELHMGDAPAPIVVDANESDSFMRIGADEGARVTTRANASETASFRAQGARPIEAVRMSTTGRPHVEHHEAAVEANGRVFAILGISALLVVLIVGWLIARAFGSVDADPVKTVEEQVQAGAGDSIEYRGITYALTEGEKGGYALTSTSEDQEGAATLCELKGTPVALILYNTAFIIPENLSDGTWDLVAYHLGGGSVTQRVTDGDGNPIVQEGEIATAFLSGSDIQIQTTEGANFTVSLGE